MPRPKTSKPSDKIKPLALKYFFMDGREVKAHLNDSKLEYGLFLFSAPGMGHGIVSIVPQLKKFTKEQQKELFREGAVLVSKIIQKATDFKCTGGVNSYEIPECPEIQELSSLIKESPAVKFCLVDAFMGTQSTTSIDFSVLFKEANTRLMMSKLLIMLGAEYQYLVFSPEINLAALEEFKKVMGPEVFAKYNTMPFLNALFTGTYGQQAMDKFTYAVKQGANVNEQHPDFGTFLHQILANEEAISTHVDILEQNAPGKFNYAAQDSGGKTLMLIACLTNNNQAIETLAALAANKDIGVDLPDKLGRTPLMVATALGNAKAVSTLLKLKAKRNAFDKKQRGLAWYSHATKETVADILRSIHIEPGRDASENVKHSWLYFNDAIASLLTYDDKDNPDEHKRVLIAKTDLLDRVKADAAKQDLRLAEYISKQCQNLCGVSILEKSFADQESARKLLGYAEAKTVADRKELDVDVPVAELSYEALREFQDSNFDRAEFYYSKAIDVMTNAVGKMPADAKQQFILARLQHDLAGTYLRQGAKEGQALELLNASQQLLQRCTDAKLEKDVLMLGVKVHAKLSTAYTNLAKKADAARQALEAKLAAQSKETVFAKSGSAPAGSAPVPSAAPSPKV